MATKNTDFEEKGVSVCRHCKHRFRRVFIPTNSENFVDGDGVPVLEGDDGDVIIYNLCLISEIELDMACTIYCSHFQENDEKGSLDLIEIFKSNVTKE